MFINMYLAIRKIIIKEEKREEKKKEKGLWWRDRREGG